MEFTLTPPTVSEADKSVIKPSKQFTKEIYNSLKAIILFIAVYILLFIAAIAFALLCGFAGVAIISVKIHWITIALGLALIASGVMLIIFLIKFLFRKYESGITGITEITADEQPKLFAFIKNLTLETQTDFPKHIYLSADVNAFVFYDSSFWSMFFPVKKNLNIGLGLVNSLSVSEFKAVLAHEFGHFSQRSMKFGSYVYNLNKIIYNMLYDNEGYGNMLDRWARIHSFFQITAFINIKIIKGIQYILQKVYVLLNKSHMRLSREMEFHADAIAAFTAGSNNAIKASRRIEIGQACYNTVLGYWNNELKNNKRAANIYTQHKEVIKRFVTENNSGVDAYGLPLVETPIAALNKQQVIIEDQWSSHPSNEDREAALQKINIIAPFISEPAWVLFENADELQRQFTGELYNSVENLDKMDIIALNDFIVLYNKYLDDNTYNKAYKGYYNTRLINAFDIDEAISVIDGKTDNPVTQLLTDENCNLPKALATIETDINLVDAVISKDLDNDINTFDFRGIKYGFDDAENVKATLNTEKEDLQHKISDLDKRLFTTFYRSLKTDEEKNALKTYYITLFTYQEQDQADYDLYNEIMTTFSAVYSNMAYDDIEVTVNKIYALEKPLKQRLKAIMDEESHNNVMIPEWRDALNNYLSQNWIYFDHPEYKNDSIEVFNNAMAAYIGVVSERTFKFKKQLFDFQLQNTQ